MSTIGHFLTDREPLTAHLRFSSLINLPAVFSRTFADPLPRHFLVVFFYTFTKTIWHKFFLRLACKKAHLITVYCSIITDGHFIVHKFYFFSIFTKMLFNSCAPLCKIENFIDILLNLKIFLVAH